jgi:hypothetical protein
MRTYNAGGRDSWLYFIVTADYTHVKIGMSSTERGCQKRLESCQTGNHQPLFLAAVIPPWRHHGEAHTHTMFQHLRVRGEWFRMDDALWAHIERNGTRTTETAFIVDADGNTEGESRTSSRPYTYWETVPA